MKLIDADKLRQSILTIMPERSEVLLVVDAQPDVCSLLKEQDDGHWIVLEYCANEGIYCSKCKNKIFDIATKPKKKLSNFCPNCGSKNTNFFNPSTGKTMYSD